MGVCAPLRGGLYTPAVSVENYVSKKAYLVVVSGCAVLLITMGVRQSFGLFLNPLTRDFQLDFSVFSLTLAIQNLLWGLSQPYIGALADKYRSGRTIVLAGIANVSECGG